MLKIPPKMNKNDLDTPCLVIDKSTLEFNLNVMLQHAQNTQINIRPHVKTHKCSKLAKLQIEYGAIGISAAKVSEAEVLINTGINNILITSPVVTENKIRRLISCIKKAPETIVVVDNERNLYDLNDAGKSIQSKINILIDLDPGIGRTGIKPENALSFALKIEQFKWLNLMGIQCYAGNLQHITSYEERKNRSLQVMEMASNVVKQFKKSGLPCAILTGTGTGTYDIDAEASEVTEIQPGSYTVMDVEYGIIGSKTNSTSFTTFKPSMTLLTTVISSNRKEHVTVDSGTKSIYFDSQNKPKIISHEGLHYDWGGFGDEHGKITADTHCKLPKNGDVLELIVPHCDPTINLHDKFYIVNNGIIEDIWEIDLRGKSQ
ncbi:MULTISPECIES: DSD1 family PLP-dependent enzyme [unclassified Legionella]|uniref:DSD1 family PLP-dependent enzyme n=1 Tax=unclassified Legionella TaxID=2622702 RepID=UPI001055B2A0|nr:MULTISPECIES: DSD1 family PLP-dependent enzyme [unclassified Legionella]MDI9819707.1 DSD1 family PLP-dependent enzyme [Legionella sp. PL877]